MKKLLALASIATVGALTVSLPAVAQTVEIPRAYLSVMDMSGTVAKNTGNNIYSVSNSNLQLCWAASGIPLEPANLNKVTELFIAPSVKAKFVKEGATIKVENERSAITSMMSSTDDKIIQACWRFDQNDPLGKYTLRLNVNDIQFDDLVFELVK